MVWEQLDCQEVRVTLEVLDFQVTLANQETPAHLVSKTRSEILTCPRWTTGGLMVASSSWPPVFGISRTAAKCLILSEACLLTLEVRQGVSLMGTKNYLTLQGHHAKKNAFCIENILDISTKSIHCIYYPLRHRESQSHSSRTVVCKVSLSGYVIHFTVDTRCYQRASP